MYGNHYDILEFRRNTLCCKACDRGKAATPAELRNSLPSTATRRCGHICSPPVRLHATFRRCIPRAAQSGLAFAMVSQVPNRKSFQPLFPVFAATFGSCSLELPTPSAATPCSIAGVRGKRPLTYTYNFAHSLPSSRSNLKLLLRQESLPIPP